MTEVKNSLDSLYCSLGLAKAQLKEHIQAEARRKVQMIGYKTKMIERMFIQYTTVVLKRQIIFKKNKY